jgi:hypothetical protein
LFRNRLSGLFHNKTHSLWNGHLARLGTGFPACSTIKLILCGTGILPVLDNGARYQLTFYAFKDIDSNTPGVRYGKKRDRVMATPLAVMT